MNHILLVVDNPERWNFVVPDVTVVTARQYLTDPQFLRLRKCRIYNLCRSYRYQSAGYYVSLLAEARGHRPIPRISTIQDLKTASIFRAVSGDLDELIQKSLASLQSDTFSLSIYFAQNTAKRHDPLARHLFNMFPAPLLRAEFKRDEEKVWSLTNISPISASDVPDEHQETLVKFAHDYFTRGNLHVRRRTRRGSPWPSWPTPATPRRRRTPRRSSGSSARPRPSPSPSSSSRGTTTAAWPSSTRCSSARRPR